MKLFPRSRALRLLTPLALVLPRWLCAAESVPPSLASPNGSVVVDFQLGAQLAYNVTIDDRLVLKASTLSLQLEQTAFGPHAKLVSSVASTHDAEVLPVVRQKAQKFRDHYNQLRLTLAGGAAVVFRAYDEGIAYRWETSLAQADVKVMSEGADFNFAGKYSVYYPEEQSFFSHNERLFLPRAVSDLGPQNLGSIPAVVDAGFVKIALADSDVEDYPGLWFRGTNGEGLKAVFPPYPLKEVQTGDRDVRISESADYLAKTKGTRTFPWRVLAMARKDTELVTNPLIYLLAAPSRLTDTSWIKPGKVAWDWWNANNFHGVDFEAGINTATYKAYIDFAAANHLSYIILDEGWYQLGNVLAVAPDINVEEIVAYGRQKKVGVILWVVWKTLQDQLTPALDQFARWGIAGIKVDFMQRDDQPIMNFYHQLCREAAARHLLVDYHGAIRPAELTRTWPNLISTEGVRGNEWNKWSAQITPRHVATLPFTRMLIGPMDFTPGGTLNETRVGFAPNFDLPHVMGTRSHEMALYVVFESPLQMLADSPSNYQRAPEMMEFLRVVPTEWDETKVLDGHIGEYVVIARRRGADWFIGAISDWSPRDLEVNLSFLPAGKFALDAYADGVNADRYAADFKRVKQSVSAATKLKLHLASGGGWAGALRAEP